MAIINPPAAGLIKLAQNGLLSHSNFIRTRVPLTAVSASAAGASITYLTAWQIDEPWDAAQLVFGNDGVKPAYTVTKAIVASSVAENRTTNLPIDAAGATQTWVQAYFNNLGADARFGTSGTTATVTVPQAASTDTQAFVFSDWTDVVYTPPASGTSTWALVRVYFTGVSTNFGRTGLNTSFATTAAQNAGRAVSGYALSGDRSSGGSVGGGSNNFLQPVGIRWVSRRPGVTLMGVGDSMMGGSGSTSDMAPWAHLAAATASATGRAVHFVNGGWPGQTSLGFYQRAVADIPVLKPNAVVIMTYSTNDGASSTTVAKLTTSRNRAFDLADYCTRLGIAPILMTQPPNAQYTSTQDAFRQDHNTLVRQACSWGRAVLYDFDAAVSDGAAPSVPARLVTAYAADTYHLNDAGQQAAATAFLLALARVLGPF